MAPRRGQDDGCGRIYMPRRCHGGSGEKSRRTGDRSSSPNECQILARVHERRKKAEDFAKAAKEAGIDEPHKVLRAVARLQASWQEASGSTQNK